MAVFITGAAGYVGRHLLQELPAKFLEGALMPDIDELNLSDYNQLYDYFSSHQIDQVFHLAAMLDNNDRQALFDSNVIALYNLVVMCKMFDVKHLTFISGNNVYASNDGTPITEDTAYAPQPYNHYGLTKYVGEMIVRDQLNGSKTEYAIVRIADIYGPKQRTGALLQAVIGNIVECKPQKKYGIGDRTRDYIFINDVAKGLAHVAVNKLSGIFNLATGKGTSVARIIEIAEKISECKVATIPVTVEKEDHTKVVLNPAKMTATGFRTSVSIEEGMREIVKVAKEGSKK